MELLFSLCWRVQILRRLLGYGQVKIAQQKPFNTLNQLFEEASERYSQDRDDVSGLDGLLSAYASVPSSNQAQTREVEH